MLPSSSLQNALQNGSLARLRLVLSTWRLLGAKLTRSWRQVGLICLLVASKIATSWPTKRQSRETAAFVVNMGSTWGEVDSKLGPIVGQLVTVVSYYPTQLRNSCSAQELP